MRVLLKPLGEQVILITGASSGIGLATAKAAAAAGAKVILIARNEGALRKAVDDIAKAGGQATFAVADVGDLVAFRSAVEQGVAHFGASVDTWVNNAGVGMWGESTQTDLADDRRLFDTNFWGIVHGSRLAVEHLRDHGGKLVNLGSIVSDASIPPQTMYSASKHAVMGFTDGLRIEIEHAGVPIGVTLIKPAAIDTPFARHARNYTGKEPTLPAPVYDPALVADAILYAATHHKRELYVGTGGKMMSIFDGGLPSVMDWVLASSGMWKQQVTDRPATHEQGTLYDVDDRDAAGGSEHGGIDRDRHVNKISVYNSTVQHPVAAGSIFTAVVGATAAALFFATHKRPQHWTDRLHDTLGDYADWAGRSASRTAKRARSSADRLFS